MTSAACRGRAPVRTENKSELQDIFFPGRGETSEEAVLKFCFNCSVREECNEYADRVGAKIGIWGGKRRTRSSHG